MVLAALVIPTSPAAAKAPVDVPEIPEIEVTGTGRGSLTAADRDFVEKVRLAGLWEIPAGNMARTKGADPRVREVGKLIAEQHVRLDQLVRDAATKLKMPLPDVPTQEQLAWLGEMRVATDTQFDQVFIDRLRAAHGKIFPAIANIRSGTRHNVVRKLAQQTNQFVMTHLTLLESSGLVDYGALPQPPQPVAGNQAPAINGQMLVQAGGPGGPVNMDTSVILMVLAAALIAGVVSTVRILRPR
jgi:predicted outer membrane protein